MNTAAPLPAMDRLVLLESAQALVEKRVLATDPYLSGHYPSVCLYPGVFILETVCQAVSRLPDLPGARLREVTALRFTAPLRPGDGLRARLEWRPCGGTGTAEVAVTARCTRDDGTPVATVAARFGTGAVPGA